MGTFNLFMFRKAIVLGALAAAASAQLEYYAKLMKVNRQCSSPNKLLGKNVDLIGCVSQCANAPEQGCAWFIYSTRTKECYAETTQNGCISDNFEKDNDFDLYKTVHLIGSLA